MDWSAYSIAAAQALKKAEHKASLREYQDALQFADAAVRETKALRIALIGKARGKSLPASPTTI